MSSSSLDDLTLLQLFVSGDATLEANQALRIQPANKERQLLGRKGALLATAYDAALPPRIEVRRRSDYTDLLHQILIDHHFIPIGQGLDSQVLCYAHCPVPEGYRLHYTEARQLWKQWWLRSSRQGKRNLQLDLFVLTQDKWYPVRDIGLSNGTLYVETLRGETAHQGEDMLAWLEKDVAEATEETRVWAAPTASAPVTPAPTPRPAAPPQVEAPVQAPPATVLPPLSAPARVESALASVVCTREGKVYVKTAAGVVVIEGDNLKAYSLAHRTPAAKVRQRL